MAIVGASTHLLRRADESEDVSKAAILVLDPLPGAKYDEDVAHRLRLLVKAMGRELGNIFRRDEVTSMKVLWPTQVNGCFFFMVAVS